jgi:hypothetical protein
LITVNVTVVAPMGGGCGKGDRRESWPLPERAKRTAEVLPQVVQPTCTAGVAALFVDLLGTTQSEPAGAARRLEHGRVRHTDALHVTQRGEPNANVSTAALRIVK